MDTQIVTFTVFGALVAALLGSLVAYGQQSGIYEDQLIVCNFEAVCQIIDIDDYIDYYEQDKLWNNFNNDLDTFDMEELHD